MTLKKTDQLLKLLRSHGVSHFKSLQVEVSLESSHVHSSNLAIVKQTPEEVSTMAAPVPPTGAAIPPVSSDIPHHVNEVAKLLKLEGNDFVEALFPDPKPDEEAA